MQGGEKTCSAAHEAAPEEQETVSEALVGGALFLAMIAAILVIGVLEALVGDFWLVAFATGVVLVADLFMRDT
jgi:flagellar biogenesis protein FliO